MPMYTTRRMMKQYTDELYMPAITATTRVGLGD
jgi:hypothetical protein